jgi:hypothetical protein
MRDRDCVAQFWPSLRLCIACDAFDKVRRAFADRHCLLRASCSPMADRRGRAEDGLIARLPKTTPDERDCAQLAIGGS